MSRARGGSCSSSRTTSPRVCGSSASGAASTASKILDRLVTAHAPPAKGVDDLMARDRVHPRREPHAAVPSLPLQMDRQQSLLHHILDIPRRRPWLAKTRLASSTAQHARFRRAGAGRRPSSPAKPARIIIAHFSSIGRRTAPGSFGLRPIVTIVTAPAVVDETNTQRTIRGRRVTRVEPGAKNPTIARLSTGYCRGGSRAVAKPSTSRSRAA